MVLKLLILVRLFVFLFVFYAYVSLISVIMGDLDVVIRIEFSVLFIFMAITWI